MVQAKVDTGKGGGVTPRRAQRITPRKRDDSADARKATRHRRLFYIAFITVSAWAPWLHSNNAPCVVRFRLRS